jgi:hypothetical protein
MGQRRQHLRFALEPGETFGIVGEVIGQDLEPTSRCRRASRARYTSPMPPAPSSAITS